MYKQIITQPAEMTVERYGDERVYHCYNRQYFYVNFKKIAENFYQWFSIENAFVEFYDVLKKLGFENIKYRYINTPQWNLATYTVNGVNNAFVIYADSYSIKVRINFETGNTRHHYVERDSDKRTILYFISKNGIKDRLKQLEEKQKKLDVEIRVMKQKLYQ